VSTHEIKANRRQPSTVPVRIDRELYAQVMGVAQQCRRKFRAQMELMLEQALERQQLETREVRK
jgi:hypothetical protein